MTGDLNREHWNVPVHGLTRTDLDGLARALACSNGTVILDLTCGDSRTTVRLNVCQAAQLSTGIWEAAGAAQQLTANSAGDQPPHVPQNLPQVWRPHPGTPPRDRSPNHPRRLTPVNNGAALDATRAIGLHIRRIRKARDKSIRVLSGLAGMSKSTLYRIENGQRDLTLTEIVALAHALNIAPTKLVLLPIPPPANGHSNAASSGRQGLPDEETSPSVVIRERSPGGCRPEEVGGVAGIQPRGVGMCDGGDEGPAGEHPSHVEPLKKSDSAQFN